MKPRVRDNSKLSALDWLLGNLFNSIACVANLKKGNIGEVTDIVIIGVYFLSFSYVLWYILSKRLLFDFCLTLLGRLFLFRVVIFRNKII